MGVIVYETPDGTNRVSTPLKHDDDRSAWKLDVSEGGVSDVSENAEDLLIPDHRVYSVELTDADKPDVPSGSGTF
ncbi:hypothetical protein [Halorubrum sp. CSM-61]|uniref:hypothetical protein n=1 Tax=Halorubrum sp. CSM-61 TaxID=2485838 RepID=UPI000F4CEFCD|nr:hypothetical protein [Halorubrum sp. CSM-61]